MPEQRRAIADFFEDCAPVFAHLRDLGADAEPLVTLLATAAFHLAGANFGRRLYARANDAAYNPLFADLNEDPTTVEVAATVLVTTSCVSTVDLCCAAIARFAGHVKGELDQTKQEWDFGKWRRPSRPRDQAKWEGRMAALDESAPSLHLWLSDLATSDLWLDLYALRNGIVHKWWRRDISVFAGAIGAPSTASPFAGAKIHIHLERAGVLELDQALSSFLCRGRGTLANLR
jgi:hypothetical protein